MKTILEVLNSGTDYLTKQGCDEARSIMQHLMAHVLRCNRTYLYSHFDLPMNEEELAPLRELLKRKTNGEPLQHLLGSTEFFKREFLSDARALIPRPETEELVEYILKKMTPSPQLRILDMGTGSGIIGITLFKELEHLNPEVTLADISETALSLALENSIRLGAKISTVKTDLFSEIEQDDSSQLESPSKKFDLIAANLPYIADSEILDREIHFDPASALYGGPKGWEIVERFLMNAPFYLSEGGIVALEIGYDQRTIVTDIMHRIGYHDVEVFSDLNGIARFPFGKWKDASAPN